MAEVRLFQFKFQTTFAVHPHPTSAESKRCTVSKLSIHLNVLFVNCCHKSFIIKYWGSSLFHSSINNHLRWLLCFWDMYLAQEPHKSHYQPSFRLEVFFLDHIFLQVFFFCTDYVSPLCDPLLNHDYFTSLITSQGGSKWYQWWVSFDLCSVLVLSEARRKPWLNGGSKISLWML